MQDQIAKIEVMQETLKDLMDCEAVHLHLSIFGSEKGLISKEQREELWQGSQPFTAGLNKVHQGLEELKNELSQREPDNYFQKITNLFKRGKANDTSRTHK